MNPAVLLIALIVFPILLLFLLRINAALVFLSLCLGDVLAQFSGNDAVSIIDGASTGGHATGSAIKLALLLAPAVLTVLFMIKTVSGSKRVLNLLPAAGVGLLTALLVVPLLPVAAAANVVGSPLWGDIQSFESGIVALSALVCLLFLLMMRPKNKSEEKHKGKKHKA